jgi:hypothetical protein
LYHNISVDLGWLRMLTLMKEQAALAEEGLGTKFAVFGVRRASHVPQSEQCA